MYIALVWIALILALLWLNKKHWDRIGKDD